MNEMATEQEKLLGLWRVSEALKVKSNELIDQAKVIESYVLEQAVNLTLEIEEWICDNDNCNFVHAWKLGGRLNVPQPVDGVLTCSSCGEQTTVERGIENVRMFKEHCRKKARERKEDDD